LSVPRPPASVGLSSTQIPKHKIFLKGNLKTSVVLFNGNRKLIKRNRDNILSAEKYSTKLG
jgi:hypothetical protein